MSGIEALKDNELIPGMNKFIDHIHHLTMENKKLKEQLKEQDQMFTNEKDDLIAQLDHSHYHYDKLKEQLKKEKSVGDDIEDVGKCYREENKKLKKELKLFKTGSKQLVESKETWEKLCDETHALLQKTNHMLNQQKEKADFYEKLFDELSELTKNNCKHNEDLLDKVEVEQKEREEKLVDDVMTFTIDKMINHLQSQKKN